MSIKSTELLFEPELSGLQASLGHTFSEPDMLLKALTHRSRAYEQNKAVDAQSPAAVDNERLEFLGDAVIGLVVAEALFNEHPDWTEGQLTVVRGQLVSRQHMAEVASAIGLGSYLRLGKGEERAGLRHKSTVLSNTMEAVLGALYLDGGLESVRAFVLRVVIGDMATRLAEELRSGAALGNYKSALQEYLQAVRAGTPVYRVKSESGPDHRKRFLVEVRLKPGEDEPGKPLGRGIGSTKKLAEQDAARRAMAKLISSGKNRLPADDAPGNDVEGIRGQ